MSPCTWKQDEDGVYETSCDEMFCVTDGTLADNSIKFCCYCGKPVEEVLFTYEAPHEP